MKKIAFVLFGVLMLAGCTTTERDVATGAAAGAAIGGIAGGGRGAVIGAGAGAATGGLVRVMRNGQCQYRNSRGHLYTAPCRR